MSKTVAILDDDPLSCEALSSLLRADGYCALTFGSVNDLLRSGPERFGCIFSDIWMEGQTGIDLLEILAGQGNMPVVILMTARFDRDQAAHAMEIGARAVLEKPLSAERVSELVALYCPE
ncbi:two-component system sensor histidine kinase/response regulator, putative [Novosphingobium nitrogenifigens DSM 19370]|uniref:Two-component system sensor histidine kinase/response regulator, putative n=1 Tax=Novosphingobium nitrogenifigens DSM 19370 TaxID=983920 RepID=F1ZBZ9_9SPHN|nr:response regulator [Novosphingobium nitrogenifigens]EGD57864.1 two-component system sensor histidine kinase/response regulator, putative [Novosphingobium nitrogenifigens DSM 19370]